MAEILKTNKTALRGCILYEFLQGKPVDEAYKTFCKTIGNDVVEYKEFKNWFNCFENGKTDLEDENFDNEPLTFSDLPNEILGEIVEKLDLVSRLKTRNVSRTLRNIVDKQPAHYDAIQIFTDLNEIRISFDSVWAEYKRIENKCLIEYISESQIKQKVINGDYLEIALNDLAIALKKPKFQLKNLEIFFDTEADAETVKVLKFLKSLKSPILVKSLHILDEGNNVTLSILSLLMPGTLEEISLDGMNIGTIVNELVKMDQWKKAKRVKLAKEIPVGIKDCFHFNHFVIHRQSLSPQEMILLRDVLSATTNFEYCFLRVNFDFLAIHEIGSALGATIDGCFFSPTINHRYSITGSNEFLDFEIRFYGVTIKKTR